MKVDVRRHAGVWLALAWVVSALAVSLVLPQHAWAATKTYTVKFAANGGTGTMASQKVTYNKATALKANTFKRSAYVFTGWNTKKDGKGKAYKDKASVKNLTTAGKTVTLYAQWRAGKTYTVKFLANGGSGAAKTQKITYNKATALVANAFTREDYAFTGWNTKADGSGKAYKNKASVTNLAAEGKTFTLYAQWKPTTYLIEFDANGGSGTTASQKVKAGKIAKLRANAFTRTGFRFVEWNTVADGTGEVLDNKDVVLEDLVAAGKQVTLFAQWAPTTYAVSYDANGGTGTMGVTTVTAGRVFKLARNGFTREGYAFAGWASSPDGGDWYADREVVVDDLADAGGTVTLYAQWEAVTTPIEPETYDVVYDANGGAGTMLNQHVTTGKVFKLYANQFTREDYVFVGWNTVADGSGVALDNKEAIVDELAPVDGKVTLYAQWKAVEKPAEPETYAIVYNANGGEGTMAGKTVTCGLVFRLAKNAFTREGYTFTGWNTAADGTGDAYADRDVVAEDLAAAGATATLYAQWEAVEKPAEPETYAIAYDANGGEGEMAEQVMTEGESVRLRNNSFTRENYAFVAWNTKADGSGDSFSNRDLLVFSDMTPQAGRAVLYAQWKAVDSTVIFDPNGGTGEAQRIATSSPNWPGYLPSAESFGFEKEGYCFYGWTSDPTAASPEVGQCWVIDDWSSNDICLRWYDEPENGWIDSISPKLGETKTLYAVWSKARTIHFDANGMEGATLPSDIVQCGELPVCMPMMELYDSEPKYVLGDYYIDYWSLTPDGAEKFTGRVSTGEVEDEWTDENGVVQRTYATRRGTFDELFPNADDTVTLYAHWSRRRATIRFDANGGTGAMADKDFVRHVCVSLPNPDFSRPDYGFVGWNTKPDGSGKRFDTCWDYWFNDFAPVPDDGIITLYAQWEYMG